MEATAVTVRVIQTVGAPVVEQLEGVSIRISLRAMERPVILGAARLRLDATIRAVSTHVSRVARTIQIAAAAEIKH